MGNLVVFYGKSKKIQMIVSKYQEMYNARTYEIETIKKVGFWDKFQSVNFKKKIEIQRCNLNLANFEKVILISSMWYDQVPAPVLRFLEHQTGRINHILYVLYNKNRDDRPEEFDKMDKILNLRRDNSYFVTFNKKDIHVRVYQ